MHLAISPTLNEIDNIDILVERVCGEQEFHLLVVDDNSADGTWKRVEQLQKHYSATLHLLHRRENPGFRNSYIDGFRWALKQGTLKAIYTLDADLSHPVDKLPALRSAIEAGAGVAVGSRYAPGGAVVNWGLRRRVLSRNANRFARFVTGLPVRDCTSGFNGISIEALSSIPFADIVSSGYAFLIELKFQLWQAGADIVEVPITFIDRERGKTKFSGGMIQEAITACFRLRGQRR